MNKLNAEQLAEIREITLAAIQYSLKTDSLWDEGNIDTWLDGMDFSEIELSYLKATAPATISGLLDLITALEAEKVELAKKWLDIVKRNKDTKDISKRRAMNYLASCANELLKQEQESCKHGRGLTDYCEPCGRVNGG